MGSNVFWEFATEGTTQLQARRGTNWLVIDWNNFMMDFIGSNDSIAVSMAYMKKLAEAIGRSGYRLCIIGDGSEQDYDRQITRLGRMADDFQETCNPRRWARADIESESLKWNLYSVTKKMFKQQFATRVRGRLNADGSLVNPDAEFVFQYADREADSLIRKFARTYAQTSDHFVIISADSDVVLGVPARTSLCRPRNLNLSEPARGNLKNTLTYIRPSYANDIIRTFNCSSRLCSSVKLS